MGESKGENGTWINDEFRERGCFEDRMLVFFLFFILFWCDVFTARIVLRIVLKL